MAAPKPDQPKFVERDEDVKQDEEKAVQGAPSSAPMLNSLVYQEVMQIVKEKEEV